VSPIVVVVVGDAHDAEPATLRPSTVPSGEKAPSETVVWACTNPATK
jgi:hypothetical protein